MDNENAFRFFLIVVFIVQTAISIRHVRRAGAEATIFRHREEGIALSVIIVVFYLTYLVSVLSYLVDPRWMAWSAVAVPVWLRWLGAIPLLIGASVMLAGLHQLGTNLTISISTMQGHLLIDSGPYGWVRHPLYVGGMIEAVGLCLMMANWFVTLAAVLFWAMIVLRTPMEEQKLIEQFGDQYREYSKRVGRFLPRRPT